MMNAPNLTGNDDPEKMSVKFDKMALKSINKKG